MNSDFKIAIHDRYGSFSDRWIDFCKEKNLSYKLVNCFDPDIIHQLADFNALLWQWGHGNHDEVLLAKHVIYASESMGLKVFPSTKTCWSFDNKVAQKYLLEAIDAPLIPTWIFYNKEDAVDWVHRTSFPKVFKLSRGASALNVRLVRSKQEAEVLVNKAFGTGFRPNAGQARDLIGRLRYKNDRKRVDLLGKIKRLPSSLKNIYRANKMLGYERGYVYFQEFIPENKFDTRITIIGTRAFGFIRYVRENDFRASGSGNKNLDPRKVNPECIKIAFQIAANLDVQSVALDFVVNSDSQPLIVEASYCYPPQTLYDSNGYWDHNLQRYEGHFWPQDAILEDLLKPD